MTVSVSITATAHLALLKARDGQAGLLLGFHDGSTVVVLSAAFCSVQELAATRDVVTSMLPSPLGVVGAHVGSRDDIAAAQQQAFGSASLVATSSGVDLEFYVGKDKSSTPVSVLPSSGSDGDIEGVLATSFVPLRCCLQLVLQVVERYTESPPQSPSNEAIAAAFDELGQQACGPTVVFLAETEGSGQSITLPGSESVAAMGASWSSPLQLRPYSAACSTAGYSVPSARFDPVKQALSCTVLHLDVLCYAPRQMPADEAVGKVMRPAVLAQLNCMRRLMVQQGAIGPLRALHFLPPGFPHHVTLVYPLPTPSIEDDEEALLQERLRLHQLLGLPTNRPLLRVANAVDWSSARTAAAMGARTGGGVGGKPRLADVHAGLAPSSVGGSVSLIQGTYDYYHYMQDKFDDNGWGCAYRSLQTICSWFAKQLYTSRAVPSHREIQQALVSIGDKQPAFVGSKQWIGAIELGFVLDTLLGVSCKVLTVTSGADMPSKAREIEHHFRTQGTPIMIGGGVLAYTLLGIDFNERTGDCAFLILDPHYTGPEDIKRIHSGQWVAWKKLGDKAAAGGELFVKDAFYNLLCPQRPSTV